MAQRAEDKSVANQIEWRDTLAGGIQGTYTVPQQITSTQGTLKTVKVSVPAGTGGNHELNVIFDYLKGLNVSHLRIQFLLSYSATTSRLRTQSPSALDHSASNGGPLLAYRWRGCISINPENYFSHP